MWGDPSIDVPCFCVFPPYLTDTTYGYIRSGMMGVSYTAMTTYDDTVEL
jgi:hypothetical protein